MKLFKNALIYDGTGAEAFKGDILVDNDNKCQQVNDHCAKQEKTLPKEQRKKQKQYTR